MEQQVTQLLSNPYIILPFVLWNAIWKGLALWKAASMKQVSWFILFMFVNLFGLLEIAYIFKLNKYDLGSKELMAEINKRFAKKAK